MAEMAIALCALFVPSLAEAQNALRRAVSAAELSVLDAYGDARSPEPPRRGTDAHPEWEAYSSYFRTVATAYDDAITFAHDFGAFSERPSSLVRGLSIASTPGRASRGFGITLVVKRLRTFRSFRVARQEGYFRRNEIAGQEQGSFVGRRFVRRGSVLGGEIFGIEVVVVLERSWPDVMIGTQGILDFAPSSDPLVPTFVSTPKPTVAPRIGVGGHGAGEAGTCP